MDYKVLSTNQQAIILRGMRESAEADHFRATVQRNAALAMPEGQGNVDGLDGQIAAAEAQAKAVDDALAKLPALDPSAVLTGVDDAQTTPPAPAAAT